MVGSRTATALVIGVASLGISVLLYVFTDTLLVFLLVPFVPFLFRSQRRHTEREQPPVFECPHCGFTTPNPDFEYCPRDGRRLQKR